MKSRLEFEKNTVHKMINMYCKGQGHLGPLCDGCKELFDYAVKKLERCPFGDRKPFCSQCEIHCYASEKQEEIRKVMAWSGPRMILYHPWIAITYITKKKF